LNVMMFERHRRYLRTEDPIRRAPEYGEPEVDDPPAHRSGTETARHGLEADAWRGDKNKHPQHTTSIKWWCPLAILAFFCLVRDFVPDTMHIVKDFLSGHFIPLFKGKRIPNAWGTEEPVLTRRKGRATQEARDEYAAKLKDWNEETAVLVEAQKVFDTTSFIVNCAVTVY
jgi:hypothetical protein